jgi:hypothetical protein
MADETLLAAIARLTGVEMQIEGRAILVPS